MATITLKQLFDELDRCDEAVPIAMLCDRLRRLDIGGADVARYVRFSDEGYSRNLVHLGPGYVALVLCWKPGQASPIHDHKGAACGLRVIQGTACETRYDVGPGGRLVEGKTSLFAEGSVCGTYDADIHTVSNRQPAGRMLVTLHVYTPPMRAYHAYDLDGTRRECQDREVLAEEQRRSSAASARG